MHGLVPSCRGCRPCQKPAPLLLDAERVTEGLCIVDVQLVRPVRAVDGGPAQALDRPRTQGRFYGLWNQEHMKGMEEGQCLVPASPR